MSKVSINSSSCFAFTCGWIMFTSPCISSEILHSCSLICTFPLSIRLMSKMSLIKLSRWLLEERTLLRQSFTWALLSIWETAMVVKPIIAFIGVRISWDMLDRKVVLALLAYWACKRASCKAWVCSICFLICSVISFVTTMAIMSPVASSCVMIKDWRTQIFSPDMLVLQYSTFTSARPFWKEFFKWSSPTVAQKSSNDSSATNCSHKWNQWEALQGGSSPTRRSKEIFFPSTIRIMSWSIRSWVRLKS